MSELFPPSRVVESRASGQVKVGGRHQRSQHLLPFEQDSRHVSLDTSLTRQDIGLFCVATMPRRRRPPRPGALADLAPLRILTQIALLQISYYGAAIVLIVFTTFVAGKHPEPGMIFDWRNVRGDVTTGWTLGLCWMLDSLITYAASIEEESEARLI